MRELLGPTEGLISSVEGRREMALIPGSLMPMVRLCEKFNVKPRSTNPTECRLIVVETDETTLGLLVDDLVGKQEVRDQESRPYAAAYRGRVRRRYLRRRESGAHSRYGRSVRRRDL